MKFGSSLPFCTSWTFCVAANKKPCIAASTGLVEQRFVANIRTTQELSRRLKLNVASKQGMP
jgi:hypothetical protein